MAQKISEETEVKLDLKTIGIIVFGAISLAGMWFSLTKEIELAEELPKPSISRTEYDLKDQLIRETIENTAEQVQENSEKLDKIDEKLYEIIQKMKKLIVLIVFFAFAKVNAQDYTILHINSSWNSKNDYKDLYKIKGAKVVKALLEDQKPSIRNQIKSVPVMFIYKDNSLIGRYDGGISLKINSI